jgi:Tfp pilus assembly protein PilO
MTGRDRIVVIVLGALAVLAVAFLLAVSPERKHAGQVQSKVETARAELETARSKLAEAQHAQKSYAAAYASIVSLGEAVPADREVPSLVYELDHASSHDHVDFESITASGAGTSSTSSSSVAVASTGFQLLPFTFSFEGSYEDLYKLIGRLQGFTVSSSDGSVQVDGRLLSIQGLTLTAGGVSSGASQTASSTSKLKATVTAAAYVLAPGQSLMGGATASGPAGSSPTASASNAPAAAPAIVRPLP